MSSLEHRVRRVGVIIGVIMVVIRMNTGRPTVGVTVHIMTKSPRTSIQIHRCSELPVRASHTQSDVVNMAPTMIDCVGCC
jgi:hypothetical protein